MGIFSNFFKSQPMPEDEIEESENVMRKLRENRQENTSRWVASIQDPNSLLPPTYFKVKVGPTPTIEDVDQREEGDGFVYAPPIEAMYPDVDMSQAAAGNPLMGDTAQAGYATRRSGANTNSASDWVAKIFQEFDRQGDLFNLSAQGTNLVLSVHPPQYTEEVVSGGIYGKETRVRFFKGYVSTTFWGMMLHGHHDKIDVYIVPAEAILAMSLTDINQSGFSPFITIDSAVKDGQLEWHVGGATIHYENIPNLAKELLGDLIKVASGKLKTEELFGDPTGGLTLDQGAVQNLSQALRTVVDDNRGAAAKVSMPGVSLPVGSAANLAQSKMTAAGAAAEQIKAVGGRGDIQSGNKLAASPISSLKSFAAAEALVAALTEDLTTVARLSDPLTTGAFPTGTTLESGDQLSDLNTSMRTLHGQASGFVAQFKPKKR